MNSSSKTNPAETKSTESKEQSSKLPEFKLVDAGFSPALERTDAISKHYEGFGESDSPHLHKNYTLHRWVQLSDDWFVRSVYYNTLQLLDRSCTPTRFVNIPHPDVQAMTRANNHDDTLATLSSSHITEWKIDLANKKLERVRGIEFSRPLRDSRIHKSSDERKLEVILDGYSSRPEKYDDRFTKFEKIPGDNPHYIALSWRSTPAYGYDHDNFEKEYTSADDNLRLINAKLYLFDLLHNKSLVIDFPRNVANFTVLKPDLIGFNDMYGHGLWLYDICFDAVTGPSIKPHAQQRQIVLPLSQSLFIGEDYWLELGASTQEPWYTSSLPDTESASESKQLTDESKSENDLAAPAAVVDEQPEAEIAPNVDYIHTQMVDGIDELDALDDTDQLPADEAAGDALIHVGSQITITPAEEPEAEDNIIPEVEPEFDTERASTQPILERKPNPYPDSQNAQEEKTDEAKKSEEDELFFSQRFKVPGFNIYQVKFNQGQCAIQLMTCPIPHAVVPICGIENAAYDYAINDANKFDLFRFVSREGEESGRYQINALVPSMNVMIQFPVSSSIHGCCNIIMSPDSYQFTVLSETRRVIQTYGLPNPKLVATLDAFFAGIYPSGSEYPMPADVLDIVRGYVQAEPKNFRTFFKTQGLFAEKTNLQSLSCKFSLHFLGLLESACLHLKTGIENPTYFTFKSSIPVALNNAEFKEFDAAVRSWTPWINGQNVFPTFFEHYKKAFYLYTSLMYVIKQCKLSNNTDDLKSIVDQAMKMLSDPKVKFKIYMHVGASRDEYHEFREVVNKGRSVKVLSAVELLLKSAVQTAAQLAPEVEKEWQESSVGLGLSGRR